MAKKVLMVLTNHGTIEGTETNTGWYLPECAHPYTRFKNAGFDITMASIKGGACPVAQASLDMNDAENKAFWETPETKSLTENTKILSECNANDYDLVFYVGGFGTMWDFPFDDTVANMTKTVYEKGGFVGSVCHGPIALANVKLSNGEYLVKGKNVAGFCNEEEEVCGLLDKLPVHDGAGRTCEEVLIARGGVYTKAAAWQPHVVSSERLFSGQNPASAGPVGDALVAALTSA